jgi:hypothetical protein
MIDSGAGPVFRRSGDEVFDHLFSATIVLSSLVYRNEDIIKFFIEGVGLGACREKGMKLFLQACKIAVKLSFP